MTIRRHQPSSARRATRDRRLVATGPTSLAAASALVALAALSLGAPAAQAADKGITLLPPAPKTIVKVAAERGHLVAMRTAVGGSELVELVDEKAPRVIAKVAGDVTPFSIGTDAKNRTVVVVQPCVGLGTRQPVSSCPLSVIDLSTRRVRELSTGIGALIGDLDRGRAVVARPSKTIGVAPAIGASATAKRLSPIPVTGVLQGVAGADIDVPSREITAIDLRGNTLAAVVEYYGGSSVVRRIGSGPWQLLARSGYGEASGIPRVFRGLAVTPTGVRAFYDGGDNDRSYAVRFTPKGIYDRKRRRTPTAKTIFTHPLGVDQYLDSAAFDGDRIISVVTDGLCGEPEVAAENDCGVRSHGPVKLG